MESAVQATDRVGQVIADKYALLRVLGTGGMGAVYEAEHAFTGRRVAVKLMHASFAGSGVAAERFIREAQAPCRIGHPGIVDVLDGGRDGDGTLYLVLEMLSGMTLADAMQGRSLSAQATTEIAIELLDALRAAHAAGFIHRDIKPENIFLADEPGNRTRVKLLDFGVAGVLSNADQQLTMTGAILGTPLYMSPEQAKGQRVSPGTDLWAVGALMYTALAGQPPFTGDTYNALIVSIATREHVPLSHLRPELPRSLLKVIERALRKDLDQRWHSADAMRVALEASLEAAMEAGDPGLSSYPPPKTGKTNRASAPPTAQARRRPPGGAPPVRTRDVGPRDNVRSLHRETRPEDDAPSADGSYADTIEESVYTATTAEGAVPPAALERLSRANAPQSPTAPWLSPWTAAAAVALVTALGGLWFARADRVGPPGSQRLSRASSAPRQTAEQIGPTTTTARAEARRPTARPDLDNAAGDMRAPGPFASSPEAPSPTTPSPEGPVADSARAPDPSPSGAPDPDGNHDDSQAPLPASIGTEVLARVVTAHQPALERCYQDVLATAMMQDPQHAGSAVRVDVTMNAMPDGSVRDVRLTGAQAPGLSDCLEDRLATMVFPRAAQATEVAFPIVFQPQVMGQ